MPTDGRLPSATPLAIAPELDKIIAGVEALQHSFEKKASEFKDNVKVGRTCWQDALPLTLGQEFEGFATLMKRLAAKLKAARPGCFEIVMGVSAIGTGLGADPGYMDALYKYLSEQYGETVRPAESLFDGYQKPDFCVTISDL